MITENALYFTDMSLCEPRQALSRETRPGCWRLVDYVAEGVSGTLVYALAGAHAPELTFPLEVEGWHEIHVGLWSFANDTCWLGVKLSSDPCFVFLSREKPDRYTLEEFYWKTADLTGQRLIMAQQGRGAFVAYIRLVPLSDEEVAALQRDRARTDTRRLVAHADLAYLARGIRESIEPYRHTDFRGIYWEAVYGTRCVYPTRVGEYGRDPRTRPVLDYETRGCDPLQMAAEHAHDVGLEIYPSIRVEMFGFPPPRDEETVTDFFRDHPEWRCVDRDGTPIDRLSYAYPQVRERILDILEEVAGYDVDGVGLLYHRGPPYLLYEAPLLKGFRAEYGQDPLELDEWDERWLTFRARVMTRFMTDLRARLDRVGVRRGVRLRIGSVVPAEPAECRFYGLDVETWAREGLTDHLIPFPDGHGERQIFFDNVRMWCSDPPRHPIPLGYWARVVSGTGCELLPALMPRSMPAREYRRRAMEIYEAGATGIFFWDCYNRNILSQQWRTLRRLGHIADLPWQRSYEQLAGERPWDGHDRDVPKVSYMWEDPEVRTRRLQRLGGFTVDRYPADWAG
ncbi:MAG: family 10 glycosylhydrolase [Chloroflexi bacterium]|nr:family 10 glycosylhydrolase [Chloroflexota bacterium]